MAARSCYLLKLADVIVITLVVDQSALCGLCMKGLLWEHGYAQSFAFSHLRDYASGLCFFAMALKSLCVVTIM